MANSADKTFWAPISEAALAFSSAVSDGALQISHFIAGNVLQLAEQGLAGLAKVPLNRLILNHGDEYRESLENAAAALRSSTEATRAALTTALLETQKAFEVAQQNMRSADQSLLDYLFEGKDVASVIGSTFKQPVSNIQFSFRHEGRDISIDEQYQLIHKRWRKRVILFVPGLFCDETVWVRGTKPQLNYVYLADELEKKGHSLIFTRFNNGAPIAENGRMLLSLLEELFAKDENLQIDIISYSLGSLIVRSMLYYATEQNSAIKERLQKLVFINSPDSGSYLEKVGYAAGQTLLFVPTLFLNVLAFIGQFRSDGIKDLSHGVIKDEEFSLLNWHPIRYFTADYHGELEGLDVYQAYTVLQKADDESNDLWSFLGDGVVEYNSLTALRDKVFRKLENPELRSLEVPGVNHFDAVRSDVVYKWLLKVLKN